MAKIELFKNKKLEYSKEIKINDNQIVFDNMTFDLAKLILTKDDQEYKYELDFTSEKGIIYLKKEDISFDIVINISLKEISDKRIKITYNMDPDDEEFTSLIITL